MSAIVLGTDLDEIIKNQHVSNTQLYEKYQLELDKFEDDKINI